MQIFEVVVCKFITSKIQHGFPVSDGGITFDEMFVALFATSSKNNENGNISTNAPNFSFNSGVQE